MTWNHRGSAAKDRCGIGGIYPKMQTSGILHKRPLSYKSAMHSTEIRIPAGNGITWGVLRAGGFSGKNSPYTLLMTLKSFPDTMKIVVFTTLLMLLPASSKMILMF